MPVQRKQWLMNSAGARHSGQQRPDQKPLVSWKVFKTRTNTLAKHSPKKKKKQSERGSDCESRSRWWRAGGVGRLGSSGYDTKCLYEALCLLETVRDGALLLREERRFVFIGCLECVEDCGHLLY